MDKNRILSARFLGFSKYLGIVAAISFVVFLIINVLIQVMIYYFGLAMFY